MQFIRQHSPADSPGEVNEVLMATFYQQYFLEHKAEFASYHRQSWQSTFRLLFEEYRYAFYTIRSMVKGRTFLMNKTKKASAPSPDNLRNHAAIKI